MIENIETMMGPEPEDMGFIKNAFWGRLREDMIFPYPKESDEERAECDALLEELEEYLETDHPRVKIDQEEYIPESVIERLFDMGVMGMIIPEEYGGLGLGVTSYNRVLELIGRYCGSTAVMVSAHQSIGCKALVMFGTEEQKEQYLEPVARGGDDDTLGRFIDDLAQHQRVEAVKLRGPTAQTLPEDRLRYHVNTPEEHARANEMLAEESVLLEDAI